MIYRKLEENEISSALKLAMDVFMEFEAPDYPEEGVKKFNDCITNPTMDFLNGLEFYGAIDEKSRLIGMIAIRKEANHVVLCFVDGKYHRQGIGASLMKMIVDEYGNRPITLNASPFGIPFYEKLGYISQSKEQLVDGIRFTPMKFTPEKYEDKIPKFESRILSQSEAEEICIWKYDGPYAVYNLPGFEKSKEYGVMICDTELRQKYCRSIYLDNSFFGYYTVSNLDGVHELSVGIRPDECGKHYGKNFMKYVVGEVAKYYPNTEVFLRVRPFNERAIRCYHSVGFREAKRYFDSFLITPGEMILMTLTEKPL